MPRSHYQPADLTAIFGYLDTADARAAITVSGALLEHALQTCILSRLREPTTQAEKDILFHDSGIIRTFSEKIWIAFFLKIIGPEVRRDIDLIRLIRNQAAHDMNPISFETTQEISGRCRALNFSTKHMVGAPKTDERTLFLAATQFYIANLWMRSGDSQAEIAEAFSGLAPYLDA